MGGEEPEGKRPKTAGEMDSLSCKQYLDSLVVPQLLPALNAVSVTRPADPIQFLAEYLIKHKTGEAGLGAEEGEKKES